jgi:putative transposase
MTRPGSLVPYLLVATLDGIAAERGAPKYIRCDNGPELIAAAVADWCRFNTTATVFIEPGSPWQNAWIESFNGKLRDELLNGELFDNLLEARVELEDWRIDYNMNRPHSSLGYLTPNEYADRWHQRQETPTLIAS